MIKTKTCDTSLQYCVEYLEDEEDIKPWIENYGILNSNTGELEFNLQNTEKTTRVAPDPVELNNEEEIVTTKEYNAFDRSVQIKHSKKCWRETNKQEWFSVYKRYMRDRRKGKHTVNRTEGVYEKMRREVPKETDKRSEEAKEHESDIESESEPNSEQYNEVEYLMEDLMGPDEVPKEIDNRSEKAKEENSDVGSVKSISNSEQYSEVEFLIEDLMGPDEVPEEIDKRSEEAKEEDSDVGLVKSKPNSEQYNEVEYLMEDITGPDPDDFQRRHVKTFSIRGRLRHNSLKLLKHSNICIFKWSKDTFQCFCCLQHFKHMSMLRAHTKTNHNFKEIRSKIICSKQLFHKVDVSDLKCSICDLSLDDLQSLQCHLKIHRSKFKMGDTSLMPYKLCSDFFTCQICHEILIDKKSLQKHMTVHFTVRHCDICNARFNSRKELWLHKCCPYFRYKCVICDVVLKSSFARRKHESKVHGLVGNERPALRFQCKFCSETFKYNYKRLEHVMAAHNEEATLFKCSFCPRIFVTVYWCNKHVNSVHRQELI